MVQCQINHLGEDDVIFVTGGTKPHVGAIVIAVWEEGQPNVASHSLSGHKEEGLFTELAKVWCHTFRKTVVVSGGIHVDNATAEDIDNLVNAAWESFFNLMADHKVVAQEAH
ncbi:hypothetical protein MM300_02110 [Evansella sp. LMS18]|uniref:prenylated flavin chaperone LpdD n=1 Tax=Evansella sp. LMS18 TaxID=2924033 RepID=UPI0020D095B8|nr:hypothetical protein [Evansella sp. LMS18]UTR11148.1 hypothetical protein MM300_02110 [Evansella sp. LMS18]